MVMSEMPLKVPPPLPPPPPDDVRVRVIDTSDE
jgi:hypothetical protein